MFSELFSKYFFKLHTKALNIPPPSWNSDSALAEIKSLLKEKGHKDEAKILILDFFIYDLNYAIEKHLDADLWNLIKKNIEAYKLQLKSDNSSKLRALFTDFLHQAKGIYFRILHNYIDVNECFQNIPSLFTNSSTFSVDKLHFVQKANRSLLDVLEQVERAAERPVFPQKLLCRSINSKQAKEVSINSVDKNGIKGMTKPTKKNILYIVQHCCVHLGDLYRYINELDLSEKFYKMAIEFDPLSGHSYNQLAISNLTNNNESKTIDILFNYIVAFTCSIPFLSAEENLKGFLSMEKENQLPLQSRIYHVILAYYYNGKFICYDQNQEKEQNIKKEDISKLLFVHIFCGDLILKMSEQENQIDEKLKILQNEWANQTKFIVKFLINNKDNSGLFMIFKWIQINENTHLFKELKSSFNSFVDLKLEARFDINLPPYITCIPTFKQNQIQYEEKLSKNSLYNLVEWSQRFLSTNEEEKEEDKLDSSLSRSEFGNNKSLILTAKEG